MAYEDIYKGLTDKEKEEMVKSDIPKFETTKYVDLTKKELEQGEKDLFQMMEKFSKQVQLIPLG